VFKVSLRRDWRT